MKRNRDVWKGLIAIEGIDGAGTTTLVRKLSEALASKGLPFTAGCEPTDGVIGRIIRAALSGEEKLQPETLALLFAADRREHLYGHGGIKKILDSGGIYLTDRYWFSSLAYQTLDADWDWVEGLNSSYPLPGHLIYLGLSVDEAQKRISSRDGKDIFDDKDLQKRVSDAYDRSIDLYADSEMKILFADSTKSPDHLLEETLEFLGDII